MYRVKGIEGLLPSPKPTFPEADLESSFAGALRIRLTMLSNCIRAYIGMYKVRV